MCVCVWWLEPAIQSTSSPWSAVNFKKTADLDKVYFEPAIWSRDTGQRIPCFDRCQLTITLMSNIKDVCCKLVSVKWSIASLMSSKLEPVIWLRVLVTLAYMKGRTDVRTYVRCSLAKNVWLVEALSCDFNTSNQTWLPSGVYPISVDKKTSFSGQ